MKMSTWKIEVRGELFKLPVVKILYGSFQARFLKKVIVKLALHVSLFVFCSQKK